MGSTDLGRCTNAGIGTSSCVGRVSGKLTTRTLETRHARLTINDVLIDTGFGLGGLVDLEE